MYKFLYSDNTILTIYSIHCQTVYRKLTKTTKEKERLK